MHLDEDGGVVWDKNYGGTHCDWFDTVIQGLDGGYILTGNSSSGTSSYYDGNSWIVRLNEDGSMDWERKDVIDAEFLKIAASIEENYYYTVGTRQRTSGCSEDLWISKLDVDGSITWQKSFSNATCENRGSGIVLVQGGGCIAVGYQWNVSNANTFPIVRLDSAGETVWNYYISSDNGDEKTSNIILLPTGEYKGQYGIMSSGEGVLSDGYDSWLTIIDEDGAVQQTVNFGAPETDSMEIAATSQDGGYIFWGYNTLTGNAQDFRIMKTDADFSIDCEVLK